MKNRVLLTLVLCLSVAAAGAFGATAKKSDVKLGKSSTTKVKASATTPAKAETTPIAAPTAPIDLPVTAVGDRAGEEINWQVISCGGNTSTVGSLVLGSTIGQVAAGRSTVGDLVLNSGYWQNFEDDQCCVIRGDADHSGSTVLDIADLVYMVTYMFQDGPEPECMLEIDVNGSGGVPDIEDLVYFVTYGWQDGPPPIPCP